MALSASNITKIKKAIKGGCSSLADIKEKTGIVGLRKHLNDLCNDGVLYCKGSTFAIPVAASTVQKAPLKAKLAATRKVEPITVNTVKAMLDAALAKKDTALLEGMVVDVLDNFTHERSGDFWALRYCAQWVKRGNNLTGEHITKAYLALVGSFLPHLVKLMVMRGEGVVGKEKMWAVDFRNDAGINMSTKVRAVSPAVGIVTVRRAQRNGFHLEGVSECAV